MPSATCNQITSQLDAYLDGTLSVSNEAVIDAHLDQCDACTARLNDLLVRDSRWRLTPPERAQLQRWLRAAYTLSPQKETEGIEAIIALAAQEFAQDTAPIAWAAEDMSELDGVRQRLGAAFVQRGPIAMPPYMADLYVRDQHSALLAFSKNGEPTTELDGHTIDFFVADVDDEQAVSCSQTIDAGVAVIDFTRLHLAIDDYTRVGIRLYRDAAPPIEGRL